MAQNEAVFAVRITDNGTLQIVQKEAKKAAAGLNDLGAATDRAAEGQDHFNRGQKGVIGATANGTKSFSKMRDAIGGSSGLVGAYATLAANLFALSAAFSALNRAFQAEQLAKSIEFLSASSGTNLARISKNLVEVTGNAISMSDAMKSASFGTSAGFNSTQLETLAKVAKGASIALGRDLNDSFDRLTRGAAKLEPEILDELGIIVRIDKATSDYAAAVGKGVKELTLWERQQAFVNAINQQGIAKYGQLADAIDTSPYDRIVASATNASNATLKWLNDTLKLPTFLNYLADNTAALTGAIGLFASTISRQMLPVVYKIPEALAGLATTSSEKKLQSLSNTFEKFGGKGALGDKGAEAIGLFNKSLREGTLDSAKMIEVTKGLEASQGGLQKAKTRTTKKITETKAALDTARSAAVQDTAAIAQLEKKLKDLQLSLSGTEAKIEMTTAAMKEQAAAAQTLAAANAKATISNGVAAIGAFKLVSGWADIFKGIGESLDNLGPSRLGKIGIGIRGLGIILGGVFSGALATILTFLSVISILTIAFPGLSAKVSKWWDEFSGGATKAAADLSGVQNKLDELSNHIKNVKLSITIDSDQPVIDATVNALTRLSGVLVEVGAVIAGTYRQILSDTRKMSDEAERASLVADKVDKEKQIRTLKNQLREKGITDEQILGQEPIAYKRYGRGGMLLTDESQEVFDLMQEYKGLTQEVGNLDTKITGLNFDDIIASAQALPEGLKKGLKVVKAELSGTLLSSIADEATRKATEKDIDTQLGLIEQKVLEVENRLKEKREAILARNLAPSATKQALATELNLIAVEGQAQIDTLTTKLTAPYQNFVSVIKATPDAINQVSTALDDAASKTENKFSKALEALKGYNAGLVESGELGTQLNNVLGKFRAGQISDALKIDTKALEVILESGANAEAKLPGLKQSLSNAQQLVQLFPTSIKSAERAAQLQEEIAAQEITSANATLAILKEQEKRGVDTGIQQQQVQLEINAAVGRRILAQNQVYDAEVRINQEIEKQAKVLQQINELALENYKGRQRLENFAKTGNLDLTYEQTKRAIAEEFRLKKAALDSEATLSLVLFKIDKLRFELTNKKLEQEGLLRGEALAEANKLVSDLETQIGRQEEIIALKREGLDIAEREAQVRAATQNFNPVERTTTTSTILPQSGMSYDAMAMSRSVAEVAAKVTTQQEEKLKAIKIAQEDILANTDRAGVGLEEIFAAEGKLSEVNSRLDAIKNNKDPFTNIKIGLETARVASEAFKESLKGLGPGGEAIAIAIEGTQNMASAWVTALEDMNNQSNNWKEDTSSLLSAVGASLSSLAATMNAASANRIAGIDAEIAAEQKRDGKSKESLARISALEKKKEAEKKKSFEMNKKMMMAQTVINTAAAIMSTLAAYSGPAGWVVAALIGAMGAAQLAIIAGMTYQGGGASTAAGAPSSVAVGQRTSSIDLAKSKSTSGELSYLQGAQGMGGPEAFTPAFTGMKYRASGGATTGFMVGEQGPELFIPDRPGTIVPADQTANMGGVTNVNFSISAIDTQGVEDMLENQKGAIINMIRSAANSYGQPFIEQVDTSVYRPAPKSRTYRR